MICKRINTLKHKLFLLQFFLFGCTTTIFSQEFNKDSLVGKWIEETFISLDSCNIDSLTFMLEDDSISNLKELLDSVTFEQDDWYIQLNEDGTSEINGHAFCDGNEFAPGGTYEVKGDAIYFTKKYPCEDWTNVEGILFCSGWISDVAFYSCLGREGENGPFVVGIYVKLEEK